MVLHQTYPFYSPNLSIRLVAMATERLNLRKKYNNNDTNNKLLKSDKGDKAEALQVCFLILASIKTLFLLQLLKYFGCYGNF